MNDRKTSKIKKINAISSWTIDNVNIKYKYRKYIKTLRTNLCINRDVRSSKIVATSSRRWIDRIFWNKKNVEIIRCKYHWSNINIYVKSYVNICEICQRTKTSRYRFYETLQSLFQSNNSWKKIIMNFITNFSSNKYKNHVYDVCLMIVNKYTKMILYIFVTKKINVVDLIEILFEKIVLIFETSINIIFDRKSIFTNAYWSVIYFYLKTK